MIERHKTWVLAVDGARARLFTYSDHDAALVPVDFWLSPDAEPDAKRLRQLADLGRRVPDHPGDARIEIEDRFGDVYHRQPLARGTVV